MERNKRTPQILAQIRNWSKSKIWSSGALFLTKWNTPYRPKVAKMILFSWQSEILVFFKEKVVFWWRFKAQMKKQFFEKSWFTPDSSRHFAKKHHDSLNLHEDLKAFWWFHFFEKKSFYFDCLFFKGVFDRLMLAFFVILLKNILCVRY